MKRPHVRQQNSVRVYAGKAQASRFAEAQDSGSQQGCSIQHGMLVGVPDLRAEAHIGYLWLR